MTSLIGNRGALDNTLAAMFTNPDYKTDYLFYAHMIGQCSIKVRRGFGSCAGIAFVQDHYNLYIDPEDVWTSIDNEAVQKIKADPDFDKTDLKTENGETLLRTVKGFDSYTLVERLAILKHEMLHILYGHVNRIEDRDPKVFNYASDCALNQHITAAHLPSSAILPSNLGNMIHGNPKIPLNESAEKYYQIIEKNQPDDCPQCGGTGQEKDDSGEQGEQSDSGDSGEQSDSGDSGEQGDSGNHQPGGSKPCSCCNGSGNANGKGNQGKMDSHETWKESKGDKDLQKDITKKMTERAQTETIKSAGTVPQECSDWMELHTRKAEFNWKRVLRGIVGNKKIGKRTTIHRRDRRFPKREDLRGKTKNRTFNLLVIADVSGSMSDKAVLTTLQEVRHICDVTKTPIDLIQIDTQAYEPEKLTKSTKLMTRKGHGGTELNSALLKAREHNIDYNAVVVLTDGYLFGDDIECFKNIKKKVIWLIEPDGQIEDEMNTGRMKAFKMKG